MIEFLEYFVAGWLLGLSLILAIGIISKIRLGLAALRLYRAQKATLKIMDSMLDSAARTAQRIAENRTTDPARIPYKPGTIAAARLIKEQTAQGKQLREFGEDDDDPQ